MKHFILLKITLLSLVITGCEMYIDATSEIQCDPYDGMKEERYDTYKACMEVFTYTRYARKCESLSELRHSGTNCKRIYLFNKDGNYKHCKLASSKREIKACEREKAKYE